MAVGFKDYIAKSKKLSANSEIAENYISYLSNITTSSETARIGYLGMVMDFLESINIELRIISIDDIDAYKRKALERMKGRRLNNYLERISDFIEYCENEGLEMNVRKEDVWELRIPKSDIEETNPKKVITPKEIVQIREALIAKNDLRKLLTFELLYGFGFTEEELAI